MSEMLGNQLFLVRKFSEAEKEFEQVLENEPQNLQTLKKIIVCHTQTGKYDLALKRFYKLVKINPHLIIETDQIFEDCPCPELIGKLENSLPFEKDEFYFQVLMGILWLYCDEKKSLEYFKAAQQNEPDNFYVNEIVNVLVSYKKEKNISH